MFAWLRNLFNYFRSQESHDLYRPEERRIYKFFNGQMVIQVDPMLLYKRLMEVGPELDIDIKVAQSQSKDANKAYESMLGKIRTIFNVKSLAEGGLTETETVELLDHFLAFNNLLKKNSPTFVTSSASSEDSEPSSADIPATMNTTDYGSTGNGCSTAKPELSPSEPVLPSVS